MKLTLSKDLRERVNLSRSNLLPFARNIGGDQSGDRVHGYENMRNIPAGRFVERGEGLPTTAAGTLVLEGPGRVHQRLDETTQERHQRPGRLLVHLMSRVLACLRG